MFYQHYYQLYDFIPNGSKFDFRPSEDEIIMADNYSVGVEGTARVQFCTAGSQVLHTVPVYIQSVQKETQTLHNIY